MKEKSFSRSPSSPSPSPYPNSRSHRIVWGPVSRAGERPFVPEHHEQSHGPDTPSLWPGWWELCIIPRNSPICSLIQEALPLFPGMQPPGLPELPSPMGGTPREGWLPQPLAWGTWQGSFSALGVQTLPQAPPTTANSLVLWGFCSDFTDLLHTGVSGNPSQLRRSQGMCSNASNAFNHSYLMVLRVLFHLNDSLILSFSLHKVLG